MAQVGSTKKHTYLHASGTLMAVLPWLGYLQKCCRVVVATTDHVTCGMFSHVQLGRVTNGHVQ